jgi:hypothetical protein
VTIALYGGSTSAEVITEQMLECAGRAGEISRIAGPAARLAWFGWMSSFSHAASSPALFALLVDLERELLTMRHACARMEGEFLRLGLELRLAAARYAAAERKALSSVAGAGSALPGGAPGLLAYLLRLAIHRPAGIQGTATAIGGLGSLLVPEPLAPVAQSNPGLLVEGTAWALDTVVPPPPILTEAARKEAGPSPSTLGGLLDLQAQAARGPGAFLVTRVDGPDGPTWVLTVPSTNMEGGSAWGLHRLADALNGNAATVAPAAVNALRAAGAKDGDPVLLNGHSQGGRHALNLAGSELLRRHFEVRGAFTAGAPAGKQAVPAGVKELSLEDADDTVPGMDGRVEAPVGRDRILVRSASEATPDHQGDPGFFGYEHRIGTYQVIAAEAQERPEVTDVMLAWKLGGTATTYRVATTPMKILPRVPRLPSLPLSPASRAAARGRAAGMRAGRR